MYSYRLTGLFTLATLLHVSIAGYALTDNYERDNFFDAFTPFTEADPTAGFVQYVDYATAMENKMIGAVGNYGNATYMGVDYNTTSDTGRQSVRLTSKKAYNKGLFIADIAHMPGGICGVWPAFWLVGPNWPSMGEIDIIEGVNAASSNTMTLHTSSNCSIQKTGMSGMVNTTDCDTNAPEQPKNAGCAVLSNSTSNFGQGFNAMGGGVYATEWSSDAISIWFFPRSSIPADITATTPDPTNWGTPLANYAGGCDIDSHFQNMNIVFDTTFCGAWAGQVWTQGSCKAKADTCEAYVQENASVFVDAYWLVNSVRVYEVGGGGSRRRGVRREVGG
ncbi:putative endo-1,3(4)-beta-glucanase [Usnea florida]